MVNPNIADCAVSAIQTNNIAGTMTLRYQAHNQIANNNVGSAVTDEYRRTFKTGIHATADYRNIVTSYINSRVVRIGPCN